MLTLFRSAAKRTMPSWMYERLIGNWNEEGFKKYFTNTSWLFAARTVSFIVSFFTIAIVARYLGPDNFGKLSYAQSFVSLFAVFASLGIDQILYRDLIAHPEREHELLGTAFVSKAFFGLLTLIAAVTAAFLLNDDSILVTLIFIVSLTFILQPFGILTYFLSARVESKYTAYVSIAMALLLPILKLAVIYFGEGVIYLATILVLESLLYAIYYTYIYVLRFKRNPLAWSFSSRTFTHLFHDAWPLMLAGLSGYIYVRIDQVMLQQFLDTTAVGLYDAAVRLTEVWAFFPGIIIGSLFPAIVRARKDDRHAYLARFRALFFLTIGISLCIIIPIFLLAPYIVSIVFGDAFLPSSAILRIYVWAAVGNVMVSILQQYFVAENMLKQFFVISCTSALVNVVLNLLLIPLYGAQGAAAATLITFALMPLLALFFRETRRDLLRIISLPSIR